MSSVSLYRKWRPQHFTALKGQDVIRDTISYALKNGQLSQAYLFCGPRGTGKTTTARLIAKFINCLDEQVERPCNACSACKAITDGSNLDILEIDAASNRGIDEIRQLRDSVRFAPTQAKYKVFIIDEVHMLTREAFNALLKTLEEPPTHTIFILATTEAHKIPPTIISRCQRYDFRLATEETLASHLLEVAQQEQIKLSPEAARFIARLGEGSFRDSLSLLDQIRVGEAKEYDLATVEKIFGYLPREHMAECLTHILARNMAEAHASVDAALASGADLKAFGEQMLALTQECMERLALGQLDVLPESLAKQCKAAGMRNVVVWVELLVEAVNQMKQCPIPRLPLDIAIAKFGSQNEAPASPPVASRPVQAVAAVSASAPVKAVSAAIAPKAVPVPVVPVIEQQESSVEVQETVSVPVAVELPEAITREDWQRVIAELKSVTPSLVTSLIHARILGLDGDMLKVAVRFKMHADKLNQPKNRLLLEQTIAQVLQLPLKVEAVIVKDLPIEEDQPVDLSEIFEFEEA